MDRLPPEIQGEILHLACDVSDEKERCSYATVSRTWQAFVERANFSTLYLNQARLEEAQAEGIITPVRQSCIRCIKFDALLPDEHCRVNIETVSKGSSEAISESVAKLLEALKTWSSPPCGIELILNLRYEGERGPDPGRGRAFRLALFTSFVSLPQNAYCQMPEVPSVTKFTHGRDWPDKLCLAPKASCEIASRFPNLQAIDWNFVQGYKVVYGDNDVREERRKDFATGISILPESIRDVYISGDYFEDAFVNTPCQKGTPDPLGLALRGLMKQLEHLTLTIPIGSELFNDPDLSQECEEPLWPRLHEISIATGGRTPQGHDLFDLQSFVPLMGNRTEAQYRVGHPFKQGEVWCLALAHAAAHMPKLRLINIWWANTTGTSLEYRVEPDSSGATFQIKSSPGLSISTEIQNEWWKAARVHIREGGVYISWLRMRDCDT
ncbi:hypothetical protein PG993_012009 [Apiospora rasikravindrae]|uniref:DUF6546 domain-containing protein n=1 Tax=Apiospora rasikravindrae TaxID=990691 RepID=A0ABR1S1E3_9PEZI